MSIKNLLCIVCIFLQPWQLLAKDYLASSFSIHSDGVTLNTRNIQFAIDFISNKGGGRLVFPVGRYLTGTIHLKSNVTIQLEEGAVLLGSLNPLEYDKKDYTALILAFDQYNIGITGKGMIDGQGKYVARNVVDLIEKGFIQDPCRNGRPSEPNRPMLLYFHACKDINIKKVTLRNSACWTQTYDQCRNLNIDSIYVDNVSYWNQDGIDIVDCDSVSITNCYVNSADDGICLKSHNPKNFCRNIFISNNTIRSSANAIKFGTASLGGFSTVKIINNKVFDTYRSAIAIEAVDGGFIDNVEVDSLKVYHTGNLIFLRTGKRWTEKEGSLRNVIIKNVYAEIAATKPDAGYGYEGPIEDLPRNVSPAIIIAGLSSSPITNIGIKNIVFKHPGGGNAMYAHVPLDQLHTIPELPAKYPEFSMFKELPAWGIFARHASEINFENITMLCEREDFRLPIVLDDVHKSQFSMLKISRYEKDQEKMYQHNCTEIIRK